MLKRWVVSVALIMCLVVWLCPVALSAPGGIQEQTPLNYSSAAKINNIELAVYAIDGVTLRYGDTFSFNDVVGPRTTARGYRSALNGRGVKVIGGGVAQAATTLYLALLHMDDIEYNRLYTYNDRFTDDYVSSGYRAVITDYDDGIDFSFTSYYSGEITISMWVDSKTVYCFLSLSGGGSGYGGDLVGYASTPLFGTSNKIANIELASNAIYGTTLRRQDTFSFNDVVGPRTDRYGYKKAVNGRGVQVVGGGVAQVASTVYLAVKNMNSVAVTKKSTYGSKFTEWYVDDVDDAIVTDYTDKVDFAFRYNGYGKLVIYTYVSGNDVICEIFEE